MKNKKRATKFLIVIILLLFIINNYAIDWLTIDDFDSEDKVNEKQIELFEKNFSSEISIWYSTHNDYHYFSVLDKYFNTLNKKNLSLNHFLKTDSVDIRIKSGLYLFSNDTINYFQNIKNSDLNFIKLVKHLKHSNEVCEDDLDKIVILVNKLELDHITFFLTYVAYKLERKFLPVVYKIDTSRFNNAGLHSELAILEIEISMTINAFLDNDTERKVSPTCGNKK